MASDKSENGVYDFKLFGDSIWQGWECYEEMKSEKDPCKFPIRCMTCDGQLVIFWRCRKSQLHMLTF